MNILRLPFMLMLLCAALISSAQLAHTESQQARQQHQPATQTPQLQAQPNATFTYVVTDAPDGTFGYDILSDGKLFVRQQNIPGQPGNMGCATKEEAERLAAFVITKVKKGEMPPTVMKEDLDELKIKH